MVTTRGILIAMLAIGMTIGPVVMPVAASHPCLPETCAVDPHNNSPKEILLYITDIVRCLVLAQPPTACV